jgi:hypothetical protein
MPLFCYFQNHLTYGPVGERIVSCQALLDYEPIDSASDALSTERASTLLRVVHAPVPRVELFAAIGHRERLSQRGQEH